MTFRLVIGILVMGWSVPNTASASGDDGWRYEDIALTETESRVAIDPSNLQCIRHQQSDGSWIANGLLNLRNQGIAAEEVVLSSYVDSDCSSVDDLLYLSSLQKDQQLSARVSRQLYWISYVDPVTEVPIGEPGNYLCNVQIEFENGVRFAVFASWAPHDPSACLPFRDHKFSLPQ